MSDLSVQNILHRERLEKENKSLKKRICELKICIGILAFIAIFNIWFYLYIGVHKGYENAVEDFYNGKLKCDRVEKNGKVKYIWINK